MDSGKQIKFNSYEPTSYKRKNIAILRSIYDEIESYLDSGCTREDIYEALVSPPYNLEMTKGSFLNAIHRIRADLKKNPKNRLSNNGGANQTLRTNGSPAQTQNNSPLPKGAKVFQKLNDAPKFEQNPNPTLDDLLKGNE
ncbi:hypothetical protein AAEL29_004449 [Salmonella enterica]|nr:hypothetical protein [Salmonella enterica]EEV2805242.1 hypothetical protein [Escherichia coli]EFC3332941.1 hypothetical protein [Escherichia coli]